MGGRDEVGSWLSLLSPQLGPLGRFVRGTRSIEFALRLTKMIQFEFMVRAEPLSGCWFY